MQSRLTAQLVRQLTTTAPLKEITVFDTALPRFALRVRPARRPGALPSAWYFIRYVAPDRRERKLRVGSPVTMELDEARRSARTALRRVDEGEDPAADRAALREAWTVAKAVEAYLASSDAKKKSPKSRQSDRSALRNHVVYRLGREKLSSIDVPTVRRLVRDIEADTRQNTRKRRLGGAGCARKVVRTLSSLLTWAVGEGQLPRNSIVGNLRLQGDGTRETVVTSPAEYSRLLEAMDRLVDDGRLRPQSRAFLTLAAATGMRRDEMRTLKWGQIDLADRRITLRDTKGVRLAKSGLKTETVSLPPIAAAALAAIRPEAPETEDRVFVPQRGEVIEINRDWVKVRTAAELPADLTLHGLRHSAGTVAVLAGLSLPEVQKLLRHRNASTAEKYIHLADRSRLQDRALSSVLPVPRDELPDAAVVPLAREKVRDGR